MVRIVKNTIYKYLIIFIFCILLVLPFLLHPIYYDLIILFWTCIYMMLICASFHEEINEIWENLNSNLKIKSLISKNISQFLLFVLMLIIMALYGNCVAKNNISDAIFKQYVIGDYILDIAGILASISAIIISISILIIQHSVERQSSILLWLFVRDSRFYALGSRPYNG